MVTPVGVDKGIPPEVEIEKLVRDLNMGREGGPYGKRRRGSKGVVEGGHAGENPVRRRWQILMLLIQRAFGDGTLPEELEWATMISLPKGKGEYWGTRLTEGTWKVCTMLYWGI